MFKTFWNAFALEARWCLTGVSLVCGFVGFLYGLVLVVTWLETLFGAVWAMIIVAALMLLFAGTAFGIKNVKDYAYIKKQYDEKRAKFQQVLNDYNIANANCDFENVQKFKRALDVLNEDIICYEKELRRIQECRNWR
jgi:glucan phosphoethanolaminetransferase (alkaline phosphatase superfamily)